MMPLSKNSLLQEPDSVLMFLRIKSQNIYRYLKAGGGGLLLPAPPQLLTALQMEANWLMQLLTAGGTI